MITAMTKKRLPVIFNVAIGAKLASLQKKQVYFCNPCEFVENLATCDSSVAEFAVWQHVVRRNTRLIQNILCKMSFFYCLYLFLCVADAFNLEPRLPVLKLGEKGSYFGYSVAEHQILNSRKSDREHV